MPYKRIRDAVEYLQSRDIDSLTIMAAFDKASEEYKNKSVCGYSRAAEEEYISKRIVELLDIDKNKS